MTAFSAPSRSLAHPTIVLPAATPGVRTLRRAWQAATWGYAVSIAVQTFFAGMFVFVGHDLLAFHKNGAHVVGLMAILTVVLAFAGRLPQRSRRQSLALFALLAIQGGLVHLLVVSPWIAALHPVNALVLFWASFTVARGSADAIARAEGAASPLPQPVADRRTLRPEPA